MKAFATPLLLAALALTPVSAKANFVFGDEMLPARNIGLNRIDAETAAAARQAYFDFDALLGVGALALSIATGVAIGAAFAQRRNSIEAPALAPEIVDLANARLARERAQGPAEWRRAA